MESCDTVGATVTPQRWWQPLAVNDSLEQAEHVDEDPDDKGAITVDVESACI
jgi:hypothetical protein